MGNRVRYMKAVNKMQVKYILDHFEAFKKLCRDSLLERQNDDDFAPYRNNPTLSASHDPDSEEWKKGV